MARERAVIGEVSEVVVTNLSEHPTRRRSGEIVRNSGFRARGRVYDSARVSHEVSVVRNTAGEAKREARRRLNKLAEEIRAGLEADRPRTVGELAQLWLDDRRRRAAEPPRKASKRAGRKVRQRRRLSPNTLASYESVVRRIVIAQFGSHAVDDLTVRMLDRKFEQLDDIMSTREARTVLNQILDWGVAKGLARNNPMKYVSPSTREEYEVEALTKKQARRLIAMASAEVDAPRFDKTGRKLGGRRPNRDLADVIVFGLGTGARIGEILAVRICDLDLHGATPTVLICGTMVEPRGDDIRQRFRQPYPKGKEARQVPLPDAVVQTLRERLASAGSVDPDLPVFASSRGTPLWASNIRTRLRELVKQDEELRGTSPHTLRRTVGTRLYTGPGGLQDACDVLGHVPSGVTFRHYVAKRRVNKRVCKRLNTFFKPSTSKPESCE